jgi:hypothetical protein
VDDGAVDPGGHRRAQPPGRVLDHERLRCRGPEASQRGEIGLRVGLGLLVVLAHEDEVHQRHDPPLLVDQVEVDAPGGGDDGHADVSRELRERLDDAVDLDRLRPQVLLVIGVAHLALAVDGLLVDTRRPGLGPRGESLVHVLDVLVPVHREPDLRQGALPGPEVPVLGVHQDTVVIEEDVLLHLDARPRRTPRGAVP